MTLLLVWKSDNDITVVADTLFMGAGKAGLEIGPKIFSVPVRLFRFGVADEWRSCLNMGFAFAGHTAAGQVTNALASAGLQNLIGENKPCPTVREVADFYGRCAAYVVGEMRRHHASDQFLFESIVFGWQESAAVAYNVEPVIDANGKPEGRVEELDFQKFGMFAYGTGHAEAQAFIEASWAAGQKANVYQTLMAVVRDEGVPSVGGGMQAAMAGSQGVELKPILFIGEDGVGRGGFMGAEQSALGRVGDFHPLSIQPIILDARSIERPRNIETISNLD